MSQWILRLATIMDNRTKGITKIKGRIQSYSVLFSFGIVAGILCRLTDFFPYESLWSLPSIATLFGFWIASVSLITYCSSSNCGAFWGSFLYMFGMTVSFYTLKFILGFFWERFSGEFPTALFLAYSAMAFICGIGSYVLYLEQESLIFLFTLCFACKWYACGSNSMFDCTLEAKNASWANYI